MASAQPLLDVTDEAGGDGKDLVLVGEREGTMFGSVFNLTNTVIGSGVLALPFAYRLSGVLLGNIFILLVVCLSVVSVNMLIIIEEHTRHPDLVSSYPSLAFKSLGHWGTKITNVSLVTMSFGAMTSYLIIIADLVIPLASDVFGADPTKAEAARTPIILISLIVLIPLSSLKTMDALKYTSFLAMSSILYLVVLVVTKGFIALTDGTFSDCNRTPGCLSVAHFSTDFLRTIPIICFAFTCHVNVLPIFNELQQPTAKRFQTVSYRTHTLCGIAYCLVATFGYLTFYSKTESNILRNFEGDTFVSIARFGMTMTVTFSYPVLAFPALQTIEAALGLQYKIHTHVLILLCMVFLNVIIAIFVKDVSLIFGVSGAIAGTMLSFILPGLFFIKLDPDRETRPKSGYRITAYLMVVLGIMFMIAATIITIVEYIEDQQTTPSPTPISPSPTTFSWSFPS